MRRRASRADEVNQPLDRPVVVEPLDAVFSIVATAVQQQPTDVPLQLRVAAGQVGEAADSIAVKVAHELLVDDESHNLAVRLLADPDLGAWTQLSNLLGLYREVEGDKQIPRRVEQSGRQGVVLHPNKHLQGARIGSELVGVHRHQVSEQEVLVRGIGGCSENRGFQCSCGLGALDKP